MFTEVNNQVMKREGGALNNLMSQLFNEGNSVIHLCNTKGETIWTLHLWTEMHRKWCFFLHSDQNVCANRIKRLKSSKSDKIKFLGKLNDGRHFFCILKTEGMSERDRQIYLCTAAVYFRSNFTDYKLHSTYVIYRH